MKNTNPHNGFTLVETLVALIILSTTFAFVWEWFGTATITSEKIGATIALPLIYDQVHDQLELIDFDNKKQGKMTIDNYTVNWTASANRSNTNEAYRKSSAWIITLYDVSIEFTFGSKVIARVETKLIKQRRDSDYSLDTL